MSSAGLPSTIDVCLGDAQEAIELAKIGYDARTRQGEEWQTSFGSISPTQDHERAKSVQAPARTSHESVISAQNPFTRPTTVASSTVAAENDTSPSMSHTELQQRASSQAPPEPDDRQPAPASELPPIDGGRQAWTFLATATILESLIWGLGNSFGAFQDYHLYAPESPLYGASSASTAAAGTLITAGQYLAPFLFLGLLNAFPHRIKLFSAVTLSISALSLLAASFCPTVAGVIILQGLLAGWAGGAFYTPAMLWLPQWFDEKRGLATGIIFLGSGLGGVFWPFILNSLLHGIGFEWTLRALSLMQIVLGSSITYFLRPRLPIAKAAQQTQTSWRHDEDAGHQAAVDGLSMHMGSRHDPIRRRRNVTRSIMPSHNKVLNSPLGLVNAALHFLQNAAFWSVSYYIAPYASSLGLRGTTPTALLALFNAASGISYVATGKLCDVMPHTLIVLSLSATGGLLVGLLLGFARSIGPLAAFAVLYGLLNGGFSTTMSPMARELARIGSTEHSSVFLEFLAVRGLGGVAGPLISSTLYHTNTTRPVQADGDIRGGTSSSIWGDNAAYGSHGLGPIVLFSTALSAVVAILALLSISFRSAALRS